jgi:hypothetical protein
MAISNIQTASNSDGLSCSLVIDQASGNNRKVVATVHQERSPLTITAPTLDGVTGTLVASITDAGSTVKVLLYEWNDAGANGIAAMPASSGTYTLATSGLGVDIQISGISCSGAKQTACADPRSDTGSNANDPSFTLTADAGSLGIIALMDATSTQTITKGSGQTDILAPTSSGAAAGASSYQDSSLTVAYTRAVSSSWVCAACAIEPASAGGLSITSVTPSSFDDGVSGIVIAGTGFGASQGSSTLTIGGSAQTVANWSDTSITFTSVRGSNSMGAATLTLTKV